MATAKNKAAEADYSMEEKIMALYELQRIDSKIDEINKVKGELPLEVQDLEDEIAGLRTRTANISAEIEELNQLNRQRRREAEEATALIAKYEEQQKNVRNNREFDALAKEIDYQKLEIDLVNKRLKEYSAAIRAKKAQAEEVEGVVADRMLDLEQKRGELAGIEAETAREIDALRAQEAEAAAKIDQRMLTAYHRIRQNMHNGLAVVTVRRDACGGCYNRIPPQRQVDIRQNRKIIVCEYCGRILVADPETEK
jgi:predicted  nucleic acid-binding Zn-ribbon protein